MLLYPNVYLLSGFAYGLHQNVYGIDLPEENRLILVDTGLDEEDLRMIETCRKRWGLDKRNITDVLITHSHFDHAGNAAYFEGEGATICAGAEDGESLKTGDDHTIGFAYGKKFPICRNVKLLKDQEVLSFGDDYRILCLHTPGHTRGSMCYELFHKGKRLLFTGDFIQIGEGDQIRLGIRVDSGYSYSEYVHSVERIKEIEADLLLPGHFAPRLIDGGKLLQFAYREILVNREYYRGEPL